VKGEVFPKRLADQSHAVQLTMWHNELGWHLAYLVAQAIDARVPSAKYF
jgi:hypothetical protein